MPVLSNRQQHRPPRPRAFTGLVGLSTPDDVAMTKTAVVEPSVGSVAPSPEAAELATGSQSQDLQPATRAKEKIKRVKTTRQEHGLSARDVAGLLKNDVIATYGTNQTPADISPRTLKAIAKHDGVHCSCARRNLDCAKQRQRLFNLAKNRLAPSFVRWFTSSEIDNYLAYARGEKGLGELKPYFEDIERRAIRCALMLGLVKPLKGVRRIPTEVEEDLCEKFNIDRIVATSGTKDTVIAGQIVTGGENLNKRRVFGVQNPLKTFEKSIIKRSRREVEYDREVDKLIVSLESRITPPAVRSERFREAEKALDDLLGGTEKAFSAPPEKSFPQPSQKTKDLQEPSPNDGGSFER